MAGATATPLGQGGLGNASFSPLSSSPQPLGGFQAQAGSIVIAGKWSEKQYSALEF